MTFEFYDDKLRTNVTVPKDKVSKTIHRKDGQTQYALITRTIDDRILIRHVSKGDWDKLSVPEER